MDCNAYMDMILLLVMIIQFSSSLKNAKNPVVQAHLEIHSLSGYNKCYALATFTGYAGLWPLPWPACNVARVLTRHFFTFTHSSALGSRVVS